MLPAPSWLVLKFEGAPFEPPLAEKSIFPALIWCLAVSRPSPYALEFTFVQDDVTREAYEAADL